MHWHVPSEDELKLVDRFLEEFLEPEMIRLRAFMSGEPLERYKPRVYNINYAFLYKNIEICYHKVATAHNQGLAMYMWYVHVYS